MHLFSSFCIANVLVQCRVHVLTIGLGIGFGLGLAMHLCITSVITTVSTCNICNKDTIKK